MSKADAAGEKAKYFNPEKLFSVQLLYNWSSSSHFGLEYMGGIYKKMSLAGAESTLNENTQLKNSALGVVYVFIF
jgi:hypothetical protein